VGMGQAQGQGRPPPQVTQAAAVAATAARLAPLVARVQVRCCTLRLGFETLL
jgi:hypothetical protein